MIWPIGLKPTADPANSRKSRGLETEFRETSAAEAGVTQTVKTNQFSKLVATQPLEMALVFCIMANLDARQRLPSLEYPTREYQKSNMTGWDGKDCSAFIPRFFQDKGDTAIKPSPRGRAATQKLFGPASSQAERYICFGTYQVFFS